MEKVFIITDPLVTSFGSVRPPLLLSKELSRCGFDVIISSPQVSDDVRKLIEGHVKIIALNMNFYITRQLPTFEAWLRCLFRLCKTPCPSEDFLVINFSSSVMIKSHVYYAQGPMTRALDDMHPEMPSQYRHSYRLASWLLRVLEKKMVFRYRKLSNLFIANSKFCKSMYEDWGVNVNKVIYPPLDRSLFKPTTSKPSGDYVLTYFGVYGKEAKFSVIKKVADKGVKIKAFGSKTPHIPVYIQKHPNIEILGMLTNEELIELYSNALYTLFTFTHEPFGYVPAESMACGTPVLTYNRQGPSETVINGQTGWAVDSDWELIETASKLWVEGYPQVMRSKCRKRVLEFDSKIIAAQWLETLQELDAQKT